MSLIHEELIFQLRHAQGQSKITTQFQGGRLSLVIMAEYLNYTTINKN
jgi:hypothetical protein